MENKYGSFKLKFYLVERDENKLQKPSLSADMTTRHEEKNQVQTICMLKDFMTGKAIWITVEAFAFHYIKLESAATRSPSSDASLFLCCRLAWK
jgi:hypothetical protein